MFRRIAPAVIAMLAIAGCDSSGVPTVNTSVGPTPTATAVPASRARLEAEVTATVKAYKSQPPDGTFAGSEAGRSVIVLSTEYRDELSPIAQAPLGTKFIVVGVRVGNENIDQPIMVRHDDFVLVSCSGAQARYNDPTLLGMQGALPDYQLVETGAYSEGWLVYYTNRDFAPCRLAWRWDVDDPALSVWFVPQLP
jgi:hypothetical protein